MQKTKIVFMGSRPLGYFALKLLLGMPNVDVVASFVKKPSENAWWDIDPYEIAPNKLTDHAQLENIDFDFGVSINYWKIIEGNLIRKPRLGFINLHHSYNLCLRGRDMTSHAILSARENNQFYHGTTLHYTDDGLDTGPIIAAKACSITESDNAWTLFNKVEILGKELINEWMPRLVKARAPVAYPESGHPLNWRTDEDARYIKDIQLDPLKSYDIVRAFDFNGYFMPAYTIRDGVRVYLSTCSRQDSHPIYRIDRSRAIFSTEWID